MDTYLIPALCSAYVEKRCASLQALGTPRFLPSPVIAPLTRHACPSVPPSAQPPLHGAPRPRGLRRPAPVVQLLPPLPPRRDAVEGLSDPGRGVGEARKARGSSLLPTGRAGGRPVQLRRALVGARRTAACFVLNITQSHVCLTPHIRHHPSPGDTRESGSVLIAGLPVLWCVAPRLPARLQLFTSPTRNAYIHRPLRSPAGASRRSAWRSPARTGTWRCRGRGGG